MSSIEPVSIPKGNRPPGPVAIRGNDLADFRLALLCRVLSLSTPQAFEPLNSII